MNCEIGNKNAKLWAIVYSPIDAEFTTGYLFSSTHGKMLKSALRGTPAFCTCLRTSKTATKQQIAERAEYLLREAEIYKPNMVLLLGEPVLQHYERVQPLQSWRGVPFKSSCFPNKVLATYSPEGARRQLFVNKANHPGQFQAIFNMDVSRAIEEAKSPELDVFQPQAVILDNFQAVMKFFAEVEEKKTYLSFDIETIKPYSAHFMDCIGLTNRPDVGYCIPFYRGSPDNPVFEPRDEERIFEKLAEILASPEIPKVAQNAQFDMGVLEHCYNMPVKNLVWDTMVAQQNLYCDLPKDLGLLTSMYTNLPYMKHLSKTDRLEYCAMDAVSNLHVMSGQISEMRDLGILEHFQTVTMPTITTLNAMHLEGVAVNLEMIDRWKERTEGELAGIRGVFNEILLDLSLDKDPFNKFNPGSPDQKKFLMHNVLGCPVKKNKGVVTVDKNYLKEIYENGFSYAKGVAFLLLKYSEAQHIAGVLKTPLCEGRLHTKYGIGGTANDGDELGTLTGRLNSRASDLLTTFDPEKKKFVSSGRNLQNCKKGLERAMIIPDPGEEFAHCDLWAAEAFFVALDAEELEMLDMLNRGVKLHNWMLEITQERFPAECEAAGFNYKLAKQVIHSLNYDVNPSEMSRNSRLPLHVATWQYEYYHTKFPGIKNRQKRIRETVRSQHCVSSPFGRRWQIIAPLDSRVYDPLKQAYAYGSQSGIGELTQIAGNYLYAMGKLGKPWCFPCLNTHDGLVIRYKKGDRQAVFDLIIKAFNIKLFVKDVSITIPIEYGWGTSFDDVQDATVHFYREK